AEIRWRETCYRHYRPMLTISSRHAIIDDDYSTIGNCQHRTIVTITGFSPSYFGFFSCCDRQNFRLFHSITFCHIAVREKAEIRWRETCYRHYRPMLGISDRTVIIVDDGMATGLTMHAAVEAVSRHQPLEIIVAVPVASWQAIAKLAVGIAKVELLVDDLVCLETPKALGSVGFWYKDFTQTTDQEVCDLLSRQTCRHFVRP
ncbi:MAG: phosphoribosyltransferase family protein, partial [Cyanobacteria bacterium J06643_13]